MNNFLVIILIVAVLSVHSDAGKMENKNPRLTDAAGNPVTKQPIKPKGVTGNLSEEKSKRPRPTDAAGNPVTRQPIKPKVVNGNLSEEKSKRPRPT